MCTPACAVLQQLQHVLPCELTPEPQGSWVAAKIHEALTKAVTATGWSMPPQQRIHSPVFTAPGTADNDLEQADDVSCLWLMSSSKPVER